jgi:TRAP-type C4-dicarboxylate transport system permease large subunit
MLPGIIIFGLQFGIFTPTEAAVVCAVYALFVAMFDLPRAQAGSSSTRLRHRRQDHRGGDVPGRRGAGVGVADHRGRAARQGRRLLEPFMGNQLLLMIAIMVLVVIVGTALDMTPTILILTPVLMPIVKAAASIRSTSACCSSSTTRSA